MPSLRAVAAALCISAAGCSLLLDTAEPVQCATDADCDADPMLRNRVCSQGFCVIPTLDPSFVSGDAGDGCVSSELCTRGNGVKSICKKVGGACVPWETDRCTKISGAWSDPNAIVIGDIQPFTVQEFNGKSRPIPYATRVRTAMDVALADFETESPGGFFFPDGTRRPFAIVHCDSGLSASGANAALKHLTEVVGAQAVIVGADEDLAAITAEATAKQIAIACSDCVGPLPDGPLAWRIIPRLALEAPMAAWRVARLEEEIKAGPTPPSTLKVAVLMTPGRAHEAFVAALDEKLRFNGKTANDNGSSFKIVKTEDPRLVPVDHVKHTETIAAFAPDVIVVVMSGDFPAYYLGSIEQLWTPGTRRPHYITTDLNFNVSTFAGKISSDDVRRRISGTRPGFSPELQANIDSFSVRYRIAANGGKPDYAHSGYDAFYAMAFAILGTRLQPVVDGPHIAASFERLRGGTGPIDFRPANIATATTFLGQASAKLEVRGLWSDLDWNLPSRDMDADVSMYCFELDDDSNLVLNPNAGPLLRTSTGVVEGHYSCK